MRRLVPYAVVLAVGGAATILALGLLGAPASDAWELTLLAVVGSAIAAGIGVGIGLALRRRSLAAQVGVIVGTAIGGALAGAVLAAQAMFVSTHDLRALLVVLAVGATAAAITGVLMAHRLAAGAEDLRDLSVSLAAGQGDPGETPLPSELAQVAAQIRLAWTELEAAQARERAMDSSRRELVAWVSHDLRTPLAGIRAMVEALADGVVDDPATVARYHAATLGETERLTLLVDDLFELSRIQAGALDLDLQRVGLADLVSDAIAASGAVADARGVVLEGSLREPAPDVAASVPELARVIHNLLDNAIRNTPRGGQVRVEAGTEGSHAVVSVRDGCGGIPTHDLDRVFDLAFRGDEARTVDSGTGGGGGFGLAIAKGLVEAHRGAIDVANETDGCRFTIRLPLDG